MDDLKLLNDLCLISRRGVCLLDMEQVAQTAEQLGLNQFARMVREDLDTNRITTGKYYPLVAGLYGVKS